MVDVVYVTTPWFLLFAPMPIHIRVFLHWDTPSAIAAPSSATPPRVCWQEDHILLTEGPFATLLRWPLLATLRRRLPGWILSLRHWLPAVLKTGSKVF